MQYSACQRKSVFREELRETCVPVPVALDDHRILRAEVPLSVAPIRQGLINSEMTEQEPARLEFHPFFGRVHLKAFFVPADTFRAGARAEGELIAIADFHVRLAAEPADPGIDAVHVSHADRKSTRLNSSHQIISYAVFCLKKKK